MAGTPDQAWEGDQRVAPPFDTTEDGDLNFTHDLLPYEEVPSVTHPDGRRFYTTPGGSEYPSVTTVLGGPSGDFLEDDPLWKDKWVARVGAEEAEKVSKRALARGRAAHAVAERWLKNEDVDVRKLPWNVAGDFKRLKPVLQRVNLVRGIELPLWSDRLKTAGRTDLVCEWEGTPAILDFKTSLRVKLKGQIGKYFVQGTCYGEMVFERHGYKIEKVVVLVMVDHDEPLVYVEPAEAWRDSVERVYLAER
jgi:hypothetical protein